MIECEECGLEFATVKAAELCRDIDRLEDGQFRRSNN